MKRILIGLLVFCFAMFVANAARAAEIIVDDGSYDSLQAALNNIDYDTVIVEGTFDIGTNLIRITRPVKLTTDSGAEIKGVKGDTIWEWSLVFVYCPSGLVEINGNGKKLHFVAPKNIFAVPMVDDLTIVDCKITGPGPVMPGNFYYGIYFWQAAGQQIPPAGYVVIEDNEISGFSSGIDGMHFKNASIKRNTIENTERFSIHIPQCDPVRNNCSYQADSIIEVDDNVITDCNTPDPDNPGGWAICLGFTDTATVYARRNKITDTAKGFDLRVANNIHVEGNVVTDASNVGIAILGTEVYSGVINSTFKANKITGSGKYGIKLEDSSTGNTFLGNNLATFSHPEDGALYYFDETSCDNIVKGYTGGANGVVLDNCGNNDITSPKQ